MLFPDGPGLLSKIRVGDLRGDQPMQVVSGRVETGYSDAVPAGRLRAQVKRYAGLCKRQYSVN
jgi:hypothetical protein